MFYFNYKEIGVKAGYQILSWGESQTQVFHALSTVISYLPRSNVLWWQTLELLSQTCFLLLPSGSYGYDRNCWFQAMMIINIKNELPPSCLIRSEEFNLMQRIDRRNASCTIKCIINSLKVSPVMPGVKGIMVIARFLAIHVKQTQCRWIWEKKRDTSIRIRGT